MGTFDELASSGKDFSLMLTSLQEGKDKDGDSISAKVKYTASHCILRIQN